MIAAKILVIFTGGTIGSAVHDGWISPSSKTKYLLIENYTRYNNDVDFSTVEPYTILSENLSADSINMLMNCVRENIDKGYDGIIVTHGTDTLQYSASALSYAFGNAGIPIVLVSANYPLSDKRSNGYINFEAAIRFIQAGYGRGVFASYANDDSCVGIQCGNMLLTHNEMSDKLNSIQKNVFAYYRNGTLEQNPDFQPLYFQSSLPEFTLKTTADILVIHNHPGDRYRYALDDCRAIILRPYHSGTLNTESVYFKAFCQSAKEKNIPVFVVNVFDGVAYESSKQFKTLGITALPISAFVSIYIKIWIAVSNNDDILSFVTEPLAGEFYSKNMKERF